MAGSTAPTFLSLADVAALARVRRPVVSVWRSRSAGTAAPFPAPVTRVRGQERFAPDDVVGWLEATGRGNNPDARADAAGVGLPRGASAADDEMLFAGLTGLLCVKAISGEPLAGRAAPELDRLAADCDPDDDLLLAEVRALGDGLPGLADVADRLADAAYSPAEAFERLLADRLRRAPAVDRAVALDAAARGLATALAAALAGQIGADPPTYLDPTSGGSDLLVDLLRGTGRAGSGHSRSGHVGSGRSRSGAGPADDTADATADNPADNAAEPTLITLDQAGPAARLARRRLRVHGGYRVGVPAAADGSFAAEGPVVLVARYPSPGRPVLVPAQVLRAVERVQRQMDDGQRAVVLAPATVLCDALTDRALDEARDRLVRDGRVRAVVRLPKGLVPARPREQLGLWVLGPAYPGIRLDERWTSVADLSDARLSAAVVGDLVTDLVAAMGDQAMLRAHAFRFTQVLRTAELLAGRGPLVVPGATPRRPTRTPPAAQAVEIERLRGLLAGASPADPLGGAAVDVGADDPVDRRVTLGTAVSRGWIRVVAGTRLGPGAPAPGQTGTVPLLGVPELVGAAPAGGRGFDPLVLAASHPGAGRTEPGDVVFCTSPRPHAVVDAAGGSVVAYPAKALRLSGAGLCSQVVAADVNAMPGEARAWRTWPVHLVPPEQSGPADAALAAIEAESAAARTRLARLADLSRLVVQGVASGSLALAGPPASSLDPDPKQSPRGS